jgi:proline racemase
LHFLYREHPPSFSAVLDQPIEIEGYSGFTVDVGWGGWFYGFVDAAKIGFDIVPDEAAEIVEFQKKLGVALTEQLTIKHPYDESINQIKLGAFPFLTLDPTDGSNRYRYANYMPGGRIDRSPCGTGCAARAAILYEKGKIQLHEEHVALSITGAEFRMNIHEEKTIQGVKAVLPEVSGRAFIYGSSQLAIDPEDPYPLGVCLPDTWS